MLLYKKIVAHDFRYDPRTYAERVDEGFSAVRNNNIFETLTFEMEVSLGTLDARMWIRKEVYSAHKSKDRF